jgi:hypothetical protein
LLPLGVLKDSPIAHCSQHRGAIQQGTIDFRNDFRLESEEFRRRFVAPRFGFRNRTLIAVQ